MGPKGEDSMGTVDAVGTVGAVGRVADGGGLREWGDDFAAELRARIRAAAEAGRRHEQESREECADCRRRLERLLDVVERRCTEAVRVSEGNIRMQSPALDEAGNRTYALRWIGPGGERWLEVLVNPERLLLQYRWFGAWREQGVAYTVDPGDVCSFDVEDLLRRFVEPAPWLARRFPPPLP
jgi:hypothetical protein